MLDSVTDSPQGMGGCDVVVLAVPVGQYPALLAALSPVLTGDMVLTDGGSTKVEAVARARECLGGYFSRFVPAHPIAGKEKSGWREATADLFVGKTTVMGGDDGTDAEAVARVRDFWRALGARTVEMTAAEHDEVFSFVSHLPHLLAYAMVEVILRRDDCDDLMRFAAGGFHDFTRIAGSDPTMWRDICLSNREHLLAAIRTYEDILSAIRTDVENRSGDALLARFDAVRQLREHWINQS